MTSSSAATPGSVRLGVDLSGNVCIQAGPAQAILLADVSNPASSVSDITVLSAAIAAGTLATGNVVQLRMSGLMQVSALGGTANFWVKIGTTKVLTVSLAASLLSATAAFVCNFELHVRAIGASGQFALNVICNSGLSGGTVCAQSAVQSIDTLNAQTLQLGFNWSTSAAANIVTVRQASIRGV